MKFKVAFYWEAVEPEMHLRFCILICIKCLLARILHSISNREYFQDVAKCTNKALLYSSAPTTAEFQSLVRIVCNLTFLLGFLYYSFKIKSMNLNEKFKLLIEF